MAREQSLIVLPFESPFVELSSALDSATLIVNGTTYVRGRNILLRGKLDDFLESEIYIDVDLSDEWLAPVIKDCNLNRSDLQLSVRTFSKFLNLSHVAFTENLADVSLGLAKVCVSRPANINLDPMRAIHTNFSIDAYLTLAKNLDPTSDSLKPWRKHTILAWTSFSFFSQDDGLGLNIEKLDEEKRSQRRLPERCSSFIEPGGTPLECLRLNDCSTLFVDEKLIEKIRYIGNSSAGRAFQRSVGVELMSDVVMRSHSELIKSENSELTMSDVKDSVTGKVVRSILMKAQPKTGTRLTEEEVLREIRLDPQRSIARVQSFFSLRSEMLKMFDGEPESNEI